MRSITSGRSTAGTTTRRIASPAAPAWTRCWIPSAPTPPTPPNPTLAGYLQETTLGEREIEEKSNDGPGKAVKLMTLHSAKGLEFPRVYLVGLEENVLPHRRSVELGTRAAIEEERRLCYVGLTRARDFLTLSYCLGRRSRGRLRPCHPSRFLGEMSGRQWPGPPKEEPKPKVFKPRRAVGGGRSSKVTHTRHRR